MAGFARLLKKVAPKEKLSPLEEEIKAKLSQLEDIRLQRERLFSENSEIFSVLSSIESEEEQLLSDIKRLAFSKDGPPPGLSMTSSRRAQITGKSHFVEVTYSRKADYYDAKKLPPDVLASPGVVVKVDSAAVKELDDERCNKALKRGEWQTPSVSIRCVGEAEGTTLPFKGGM
jgi:hypothetical protein